LEESCGKSCQLASGRNNITLVFEDEVTSCERMFYVLTNIKEIDLSGFDSSKVTNMKSMFQNCTDLEKITFGEIKTSLVEDMSSLFYFCSKITSIDVSKFDTSSVTDMSKMFSECAQLTSIDCSNFNTAKVVDMFDIFAYDRQLLFVDVSNFETSKVRNMQGMFYCDERLEFIDLGSFDFSSVTNLNLAFGFGLLLKYLNLRKLNATKNNLELKETFHRLDSLITYCVNDLGKTSINSKVSECSNLCFQKNIKYKKSVQNCYCIENYKFEFIKKCYDECPGNNEKESGDKFECEGPVPENYYLDEDEMYRKCYHTCKSCNQSGNDTYNNCNNCTTNYKFLDDPLSTKNNCYENCVYYYYFEEDKKYTCTTSDSCPSKYSKLIETKRKCIDNCQRDDEYMYEYDSKCLKECPENTKLYENAQLCLDICGSNLFEYENKCYDDCPGETFKLFDTKKICGVSVPENYYLDNDGIYKKCYDKCKKCSKSGMKQIIIVMNV